MKNIILAIVFILFGASIYAQSEFKDKGNVNLHFGTLIVYNTYSIGYEGRDLIKNIKKHQLRPVIRFGKWDSSFANKNTGIQSALGLSYLLGKEKYFFEHSSELVFHFDKGLKEQTGVYIGSLNRLYFGYRYQPLNKKFIVKIGIGWKELFQFGFGYRF